MQTLDTLIKHDRLIRICALLMPAVVLAGILLIGVEYNQRITSREVTRVELVLDNIMSQLNATTLNNAKWDDAYRNISETFNANWFDETWGAEVSDQVPYSGVSVLDRDGHTLRATYNGATVQSLIGLLAPTDHAYILKNLSVLNAHNNTLSGFMELKGRVAAISVSQIAPANPYRNPPKAAPTYLMVVKPLNDSLLNQISQTSGLRGLRLAKESAGLENSVAVHATDGRIIGVMAWDYEMAGNLVVIMVCLVLMPILGGLSWIVLVASARTRATWIDLCASEARALHMAHHDTLTGLPNRLAFLNALTERMMENGQSIILYFDLDGFKEINDSLGHEAGDSVLRETARRVMEMLGNQHLLARLGGDEFAILMGEDSLSTRADDVASALLSSLVEPFVIAGMAHRIGASIGIARGSLDIDAQEVVRRADVAMYTAKSSGKGRAHWYSNAMDEGRTLRSEIEAELRQALRQGDIKVAYQPIVRSDSHAIICVEALARWTSPTRGVIGPDVFIPIAEQSGLIIELGQHVLREACLAVKDWNIDLAVNISPIQFRHPGLVADILFVLKETGFSASRLELEITEGSLIENSAVAQSMISALREEGIRISLDDFGTGYASIGYLRKFQLDKIKIDKSFTDRIERDRETAMITTAIIALGSALNLPITAEGVETADQAAMLRIAGCRQFQGWLFGKPLFADALEAAFFSKTAAASRLDHDRLRLHQAEI
ncbi:MAG: bifunctional diguanylate cyclase/phosphodiesterase [Sphingomonadales bacterium]|nr:MAG: bifunctional diguanylate cyclase/phosphodiesterase [Sphingomonadales bacterium]